MVFSSIEFILFFLPVFLMIYYITPVSYRNVVLLIGSLFFYAYGEPKFVLLLLLSMLINYWLARGMEYQPQVTGKNESTNASDRTHTGFQKIYFMIGVVINLAMLIVFKVAPDQIGLPLGISFYTFQSLSYLLDVYRGNLSAETSFIKLGTYICMFPQLVAGPIVTYDEVRETLEKPVVTSADFDKGLKDFTIGLVLKVLMADRLSLLWNEIAGIGYISAPSVLLWLGAISYSLQIYFDFFGYSMMAIGLGKMLGFSIPKNFDLPYTATSVRDFYRRWHMTLGRWFSKYVYIPLGGSRNGMKKTLRNLWIVWVLTALWHGVSVNFLLWGMLLCLVIMIEKLIDKKSKEDLIIVKIIRHSYVLLVIGLSWVCFAITDLGQLTTYLLRMFGLQPGINVSMTIMDSVLRKYGITILIGIFLCTKPAHMLYQKGKDSWIGNIVLVLLFWLAVWYVHVMGNNPFLYFRF